MVLPVRRVQAVITHTGAIRARFGWHALSLVSLAADAGALGDQTPIQAAKSKHKHQWPLMSPEERKGAVQAEVSGHQAKLSAAMEQSPLGLSGLSGGAARTKPPVRC